MNVKLIVIENGGYASIRATQKEHFNGVTIGADTSSGVQLPPASGLAAAYAISYVDCQDRASLLSAIEAAFDTPGPVICAIKEQQSQ